MFKVLFLSNFIFPKENWLFRFRSKLYYLRKGTYYLPLLCDRQVFVDIYECDGRELFLTHFDW